MFFHLYDFLTEFDHENDPYENDPYENANDNDHETEMRFEHFQQQENELG
jgi:hypothetical protein